MASDSDTALTAAIGAAATPLTGAGHDHDPLLAGIGPAHFVLLGEASHGTDEFYHERARITQRLIAEHGFNAVAVEADWPDAYRVNRYVRSQGNDASSEQALAGFQRFPTWMWRNTRMLDFIDWLREFNAALPAAAHAAGFYGLDLYSMFASIAEVLAYLDRVDPAAARRARDRYACFDHCDANSQRYGYATGMGLSAPCETQVVAQLHELQARAAQFMQQDGQYAADAWFHARQNARLVTNAEQYYRTMFRSRIASWNLRDRHMMETLDALAQHLSATINKPARIVVWAHNSHVGDARATEVGADGEWTLGQLARERYGDAARLIGFTTFDGTVTAAADWDGRAACMRVLPALEGSYEHAFHQSGLARFMLPLDARTAVGKALMQPRLERAIGVIYRPRTERQSHYLFASLPRQFDAVVHVDTSRAVTPLEGASDRPPGDAPATFPAGV